MRFLRTAHAWAGTVLSALLCVLGASGALLIFKADYLRLAVPEARQAASLAPEDLGPVLEAAEARFAGEGLRYVAVAEPGFGLHKAVFNDGGGAYLSGDGEVVARWAKNGRAEDWLFDLHHYLLVGDAGKTVAGIAGVAALVLVVTGIVIVWPSLRAFAWRVWPRSGARRDLVAQHRDLGIIFAAPILILVFCGVSMVFSGPVRSLIYAVTLSKPSPALERPQAGEGAVDWTKALAAAYAAYPNSPPRIVSFAPKPGASASLRLRQPAEWHQNGRTYVYIDPATSAVLATSNAQDLSRGDRVFNALYPIHSSGIGGKLYEIAAFLTGLALTALGAIGTWTFLVRQQRGLKSRAQKRRSATASFRGS
jgi:uncharacterized iron-regulated membrane protein